MWKRDRAQYIGILQLGKFYCTVKYSGEWDWVFTHERRNEKEHLPGAELMHVRGRARARAGQDRTRARAGQAGQDKARARTGQDRIRTKGDQGRQKV